MTMPHERTRAIMATREFLRELMDRDAMPNIPDSVRRQALVLLRHYPSASDIAIASMACPNWFGPPQEVS